MITVGAKFFFTVSESCTLWFLDKTKMKKPHNDTILFIDATGIYETLDRAHRTFSEEQRTFISDIVRLYHSDSISDFNSSNRMTKATFPENKYRDVAGLCRAVSIEDVEKENWVLNPGNYVGTPDLNRPEPDANTLRGLNQKLFKLSEETSILAEKISNINDFFLGD